MKRQSGCEEEGWSGDQQSGWRRGDVEMNAGQRTVDRGDGEEKTEQKSQTMKYRIIVDVRLTKYRAGRQVSCRSYELATRTLWF